MLESEMLESERKQWYVVYSKPHKEEYALSHLKFRGIEFFFPRLYLPQIAQERRRIVPLFPSYLFVKIQFPDEYHYVIWCPGVKRFVSFDSIPLPLEDKFVGFLMEQANSDGIIMGRSNLRIGQEVYINSGLFEGLVGIIQEPPDAKGRVKVL